MTEWWRTRGHATGELPAALENIARGVWRSYPPLRNGRAARIPLRLTRFLGGEPSRTASRKQYWFLLIGGAALVALLAVLSLGVGCN